MDLIALIMFFVIIIIIALIIHKQTIVNYKQLIVNYKGGAVNPHFKILEKREYEAAVALGKGWGYGHISDEVKACISLIPIKPSVFIDIGGNVGKYTQEVLNIYPDIRTFIFEPSTTNKSILEEKFGKLSNVKISSYALSDTSGDAVLYANKPGSGLASLSNRRLEHFDITMDSKEDIKIHRFDEIWPSLSEQSTNTYINKRQKIIDYVKIDVEGHELAVLNGFGKFIENMGIIQFEFGGANIDSRTYFQDFWYFFKVNKFTLYRISPSGLIKIYKYKEIDEVFLTTNYIAVNDRDLYNLI